jgi:hypothetical protein
MVVADLDLLIAAAVVARRLNLATLTARDLSRIESLAWEDWSEEPDRVFAEVSPFCAWAWSRNSRGTQSPGGNSPNRRYG